MRRRIVTLTAAVLVSTTALAHVSGVALAAPTVEQFCIGNGDFGRSHGTCVSLGQADANRPNTDPVFICKNFEIEFGPFALGRCLSFFRQLPAG